MAVKKDPRHTNNAILFVLAAILLGGAIFAGIMFGQSASEQPNTDDATLSTNQEAKLEEKDNRIVIPLQCHFGDCVWRRLESRKILVDRADGQLIEIVSSDTEHKTKADYGAPPPPNVTWSEPGKSYVFCSRRMPMLIDEDGTPSPVSVAENLSNDVNNLLFWTGVCGESQSKSYPSGAEVQLYMAALEGRTFRDPRTVYDNLPTYPKWLIGRWGWNPDDPQCGDSHTGYRADHRLDHYEGGGMWMVVNGTLWTAWDASEDGDASIDSDQLERVDADTLLMGGESYFRCPSGQPETGPE